MDWKAFDRLSQEYQETFGECLPTESMPREDFERVIEIMRECLESGKAYELPEETRRLIDQGAVF